MSISNVNSNATVTNLNEPVTNILSDSLKHPDVAVGMTLDGHTVLILPPELTQKHQQLLNELKNHSENSLINKELDQFLKKQNPAGKRKLLAEVIMEVGSKRNESIEKGIAGRSIKTLAKESEAIISERIKTGELTQEMLEGAGEKALKYFTESQKTYDAQQKELTKNILLNSQPEVSSQEKDSLLNNGATTTEPTRTTNAGADSEKSRKNQKEKTEKQLQEILTKDISSRLEESVKVKERLINQQKKNATAKLAEQRASVS